jgi:hypothetical protein
MKSAAELLRQHGITVTLEGPGEYPTTCPRCSPQRQKKDKKDLSVALKEDGGVAWYCHHCQWSGPPKGSGAKSDKKIVPTHIYRDREGIIRFGKVRNPPGAKLKCWFCHLDAGVWKKGSAKADTTIIYRADEVAEAIEAGQSICIVEGEKDADSLWSIGIPATCNAHGASADSSKPKWYRTHSEQLRGADIVVFNDNDPPGYAHADTVCKLSLGTAKRVRRLDLKNDWPDIPPKGDVSDWLAVGGAHTADKLKALIEAAPDEAAGATASGDAPLDEDAELERLARMSEWDFERARADAAKLLGVSASFLKAARKAKRAELSLDGNNGQQGRRYQFPQIEPWPTVVDGAELLDEITDAIRRHVIMPPHSAEAIALWVVLTHLLDRFLISPRLALRSVTKQCGKTTTLDIIARLVRRPLSTVNTSPAAMFRIIESDQPTLLVDEADAFLKDNEELRGIINSGHRQGGCVLRVEGDQHEARAFATFATFAPCAIAAIGSLPGTIMDRSVVIDLARRKPDEKIEAFRLDRTAVLDEIARRIVRWAEDNADAIAVHDPEVPPGIYNRNADNWRPLFQIADVAAGEWPQRARAAAMAGAPDLDEVSLLELLLGDIRDIFAAMPGDDFLDPKAKRISSAELIKELCDIEPRPWAEFGKSGKAITQNKLARLLKPLAIPPILMRITAEDGIEDRARGYALHQFAEAFERYLPSKGVSNRDSMTNAVNTGTSGTSATVTAKKLVTDEKSEKSNNDGLCHGVTVAKGENGQERPIGLSQQAIEALAHRVRDYAADHLGDADLTASTERSLRCWVAEAGVLPEHVAIEAERVMTRVWRTY